MPRTKGRVTKTKEDIVRYKKYLHKKCVYLLGLKLPKQEGKEVKRVVNDMIAFLLEDHGGSYDERVTRLRSHGKPVIELYRTYKGRENSVEQDLEFLMKEFEKNSVKFANSQY